MHESNTHPTRYPRVSLLLFLLQLLFLFLLFLFQLRLIPAKFKTPDHILYVTVFACIAAPSHTSSTCNLWEYYTRFQCVQLRMCSNRYASVLYVSLLAQGKLITAASIINPSPTQQEQQRYSTSPYRQTRRCNNNNSNSTK